MGKEDCDMWCEVEEWCKSEVANGGTITKAEAKDGLTAWAKKHFGAEIPDSMWDELEALFDAVDADNNGEIDGKELKAAVDAINPDGREVHMPSMEEMEKWAESELEKDGDIPKDEA